MNPRIFNVLMGVWLFISAFAWRHSPAQFWAALICGALTVLLTLATFYVPGVRYLVAVFAVFLFVESLTGAAGFRRTAWHDAIIAIAIFAAAMLSRGPAPARRELSHA
jgi:uncharacterized membrane protein HdeD (DUF308 family)